MKNKLLQRVPLEVDEVKFALPRELIPLNLHRPLSVLKCSEGGGERWFLRVFLYFLLEVEAICEFGLSCCLGCMSFEVVRENGLKFSG